MYCNNSAFCKLVMFSIIVIITCKLYLLHLLHGVDFFNILDGPPNGFELPHIFDDAVDIHRLGAWRLCCDG